MDKGKDTQSLDVIPGLVLLWRHRYWLIGAGVAGILLAFVVTRFIDKLYESHAVMLPSNATSRDEQLQGFSYGYEVHSERLMQLLDSDILFDSLSRKFDLAEYYNIEADGPGEWGELIEKMRERVQFHKTRNSSVVISVQDEDPIMAANLANESARLVNVISAGLIAENARIALESARKEFETRYRDVSGAQDSIRLLRSDNISQTKDRLSSALRGHRSQIENIRAELDQIRRKYNVYDFGEQINTLNQELAEARSKFLQNSGAMAVIDDASGVHDSVRTRISAELAGARQRVEYFEKQLSDLIVINKRYLHLSDQLEEERELQIRRRAALAGIDDKLDPGISTRNLQIMEGDYNWDLIQLREFQRTYQRALTNFLDPVPVAYLVSPARPNYKHIYPKTLISMVLGGLSLVVVTATLILLQYKIREYTAD